MTAASSTGGNYSTKPDAVQGLIKRQRINDPGAAAKLAVAAGKESGVLSCRDQLEVSISPQVDCRR
jgi:hypothetical protein